MSRMAIVPRWRGTDAACSEARAAIEIRGAVTRLRPIAIVSAVAAMVLCGCGTIGSGKVLSLGGLEGRWSGAVRPSNPACGAERHGLMRIGGNTFAFDPFESTTIINGNVEGDVLKGSLTRIGGGHRQLSITFEGHARTGPDREKAIEGVLASGHCVWQVVLARGVGTFWHLPCSRENLKWEPGRRCEEALIRAPKINGP